MASRARGEDRSGYQRISGWAGLDFGICKATEGTTFRDSTFAANWANLAKAGIPRGAYLFLHPSLSGAAQAAFFLAEVEAQGLHPGDILIVDSEILTGADGSLLLGEQAARRSHLLAAGPGGVAFTRPRMNGVHEVALASATVVGSATHAACAALAKAKPHNPVLVYTNLSVGSQLESCAGYGLFIARPGSVPPASVAPWKTWRLWQRQFGGGQGGGDVDEYDGTPAQLRAWVNSFKPKPPPKPRPPAPADEETAVQAVLADTDDPIILFPKGKTTLILGSDPTYQPGGVPGVLRVGWSAPSQKWAEKDTPPLAWDNTPFEIKLPPGTAKVTVARKNPGASRVTADFM